jgi:glycosyltransferase involved in cell wall biosynthesis
MKILMILSKPFKPEPWIFREAKTLVDAGFDVTIIGWNRDKTYNAKEIISGIKVNRVGIRAPYGSFMGLLPLYPFFYLIVILKCLRLDFDAIDCHNFDTLPLGLIIGKIKKKKVVYHSLDLYYTWFNRETSSVIKNFLSKLFKKFEKMFLHNIDHLIVTAPGFVEHYKKYNMNCGITVLLNLPDKNFVKYEKFKNNKSENDKFIVSYIGEIRYEKPLLNLIKATADIKDSIVLIVGGGVKAEVIKQRAKNFDHVQIVGHVPFDEVVEYYYKSDCIYSVYDSTIENIKIAIPVKVFEAMAAGKPVVVNKNVWISTFVKDNNIGLCVDENNLSEIKNVILKIKNSDELRNDFGKNGKKLFEEKYNWEFQEEKLIDIYKYFMIKK